MANLAVTDAQAIREAKAEIVQSREQIIDSGMALRAELTRSLEWRTWYRHAPMASLGAAFLVGFLLANQGAGHAVDYWLSTTGPLNDD